MPRDQLFISYSHTDKEWLERLQKMLSPLVRNETISVWGRYDDSGWAESGKSK
jgi:hypothetical protein